MKTFEINIEGKAYKVTVEKFEGTQASVVVDGKRYTVDVNGMDLRPPLPTFGRKPYYVSQPVPARPVISQSSSGAGMPADIPAPTTPPRISSGGSGTKVTAPMPGLILAVMVKAGDRVEAGTMVVRMEAMKMENEIPSPVSGTVKHVAVSKGDNVATGEVLVEIE